MNVLLYAFQCDHSDLLHNTTADSCRVIVVYFVENNSTRPSEVGLRFENIPKKIFA